MLLKDLIAKNEILINLFKGFDKTALYQEVKGISSNSK